MDASQMLRILEQPADARLYNDCIWASAYASSPNEAVAWFLCALRSRLAGPPLLLGVYIDEYPIATEYRLGVRSGMLAEYSLHDIVSSIKRLSKAWYMLPYDLSTISYLDTLEYAFAVKSFQETSYEANKDAVEDACWILLSIRSQITFRHFLKARSRALTDEEKRGKERFQAWLSRQYLPRLESAVRNTYMQLRIPPGAIEAYLRDRPTEERSAVAVLSSIFGSKHTQFSLANDVGEASPSEIISSEESKPLAKAVAAIKILDSVLANRCGIDFEDKYIIYVHEVGDFVKARHAERAQFMVVQTVASTFGVWNRRGDYVDEFETSLEALYMWLDATAKGDDTTSVARILEEM